MSTGDDRVELHGGREVLVGEAARQYLAAMAAPPPVIASPPADFILDTSVFEKVLARITYRPNVELRFDRGTVGLPPRFMVGMMTEDTYNPGRHIRIVHSTYLPAGVCNDEKWALAFIRQCVHNMEAHEADEWLKLDGQVVNNPHAPGAFR